MQTEIEFRGISVETKEFVFGQLFYSHGTGTWKITCGNGWTPSYSNPDEGESTIYHDIDYNTIGQYIGLKKGERKIYSGDILFDEVENDTGDERHYFVIMWLKEKCSFVFMDYGDTVTNWQKFEEDLWHDYPVQVDQNNLDKMHYAGNYFQNPELLLQ